MTNLCLLAALALGASAPAQPAPADFKPDANLERLQVPDRYKWKLAAIFADDAAFEAALAKAAAQRQGFAAYHGKLSEPAKLRECLDLYFSQRLEANRLTLYAQLRLQAEQKSTAFQAMNEKALRAMNDFMADTSFIRREVLALEPAAMKAAYAQDPKLAQNQTYLEGIQRRRTRVLGAEAERVLSLAGDNLWAEIDINELPSDYEKVFDAALSDIALPKIADESGKEVQLTLSNYPKFRGSRDRRVRHDAVEQFFATLKQHQHIFAGTLSGQINHSVFLARARGYDTALDAYLDKEDIDPAVYRSLIQAVNANLAPLHRYIALRKQVMALPEVHIYDLYTSMIPSARMEFSYAEAQRILPAALAPLGEDYVKVLNAGLDPANGWVDVYPNRHKQSGASCVFAYGIHPYVKMNYLNDLENLSTLAHEYGHALHSHLSMTTQPYPTANYSTFVAEIASTFNEKLLNDYLMKKAKSDDERLYLLNALVERIRTTIYRQTMFAEFELAAHTAAERGIPLTSEFLNETYGGLLKTYYGKDFAVGENDDIEWAYVPHFYYKYYVYAYATGFSSGLALAEKVQTGGKAARKAYLGMLEGGSSKPPLELLKGAGVDLTKPEAIEAAARLMNTTLAEMEKILAKKK